MLTNPKQLACIQCGKNDSQVPLVEVNFKGSKYQICTEHFPILIHNPQELTGKLPGAESLNPADHHD
jgi:hypothetical protein